MIDRRGLLGLGVLALGGAVSRSVLAAPPKRLVLIHGRSQQGFDAATLKSEWTDALAEALLKKSLQLPADVSVEFPFYGDTLDDFVRQSNLPLTAEITTRGDQAQDDYLAFQARIAEEIIEPTGITDAQVDAEYGNNPKQRGPLNWEWVQAMLRAIDRYGGGLTSDAIETFTRDVYLYLTIDVVRETIDQKVAQVISEEPTIVVGHSLGSVVAYHILANDPRNLNVPLFLTIGSPLGIRAIREQLLPLKSPPPVKAWFNAFDQRDVVALFPLDKDSFDIAPPIENYDGVRNSTPNRHGAVGYLADTTVADKLYQCFM